MNKIIILFLSSFVWVAQQQACAPDNVANKCAQETFNHTNTFRKKKGLSAVQWDKRLATIAQGHSTNMAHGKVPFGHAGFEHRIKAVPYMSASENVFMSNMTGDVAKQAVDGWIESPGHLKNLVGHYSHCGIGVHCNQKGYWYVTQIFAAF